MVLKTFDAFTRLSTMYADSLTNFLFGNLGEYTVPKPSIRKAIQYATKEIPGLGGYVFVAEDRGQILGTLVVNKTGMGEYLPENLLVFIAVHREYRGQGIGKRLMGYALQYCKGDFALHCPFHEKNRHFFEAFGFENSYMEMRLTQTQ